MINPRTRLLVTALTLGALLYLGRRYLHELHHLRNAHWLGAAGIAGIHLLTLLAEAGLLTYALRALRQPIRLREGFAISVLSRYSNLLLPRSGIGLAAAYLNRSKRVSIAKYGSFLLFNASIFVLTCSATTLLVVIVDWYIRGTGSSLIVSALLCLTLLSLAAVLTRWRVPRWYRGPGAAFLRRTSCAWKQLGSPSVIGTTVSLHILMIMLRALRLYCAFAALAIFVDPHGVLLASLVGDLVFIVSFTPTAVGLREAALICVASQLGSTAGLVLSVAMLDRLVFSLTTIIVAQTVIGMSVKAAWSSPGDRPLAANGRVTVGLSGSQAAVNGK